MVFGLVHLSLDWRAGRGAGKMQLICQWDKGALESSDIIETVAVQ